MKITVLEQQTKEPLVNQKVSLFIEGKESGKLTIVTDSNGCFLLNDNFENHQLSISMDDQPDQWVTARDGVKVVVMKKETSSI